MALLTWTNPDTEYDRLRQEVERVFNLFSPSAEGFTSRAYPGLNISEEGDHYYVRAELPGLKPEDLEVSVVEGRLVLRGERKIDAEEKNASYHRRERDGGFFRRTIALPAKVEADRVTADLRNGVLKITLPKAPEAKPRRIAVSA